MAAADPTHPTYPIACSLAAVMLLLVLLTSLVRQSWNLGVSFLCIWLCLGNLINVVNTIVWSDNVDIKWYAWCDIVSRLKIAITVGSNIAPLLITRRLHLISSLQSITLPSRRARRWNQIIEWTFGLVWPLVSAGPLYYVIQGSRFQVIELFGCTNAPALSVITIVLESFWTIWPPLISVIVYYPKVARTFYRQNRDVNHFLRSNGSVSRTNYMHILAVASVDILLTLPLGLASFALDVHNEDNLGPVPFYSGWKLTHSHWAPPAFAYSERIVAGGTYRTFVFYFSLWMTPALAFAIFGLFGLTKEARASYWRVICTVGGCFGWKPSPRASDTELGAIKFADCLAGEISLGSGMRTPSFVNVEPPHAEQGVHREPDGEPRESSSDVRKTEETTRSSRIPREAQYRQAHKAETTSTDVATQPVEIAGSAV